MRHNPNSVTQNALAEEKSSLAIFFSENYKFNNVYDMQMMRKSNAVTGNGYNGEQAFFTQSQVSGKSQVWADGELNMLTGAVQASYLQRDTNLSAVSSVLPSENIPSCEALKNHIAKKNSLACARLHDEERKR